MMTCGGNKNRFSLQSIKRVGEASMIFKETKLQGAFVIDLERHQDDRGFFARTFCKNELEAHGLIPEVVQARCRTCRQCLQCS